MKIKAVRATPVRVPVTRIAAFSKRKISHVANTIVEVETDAGVLGLGEVRGDWAARFVNERFASQIIGLPVDDRRVIQDCCLANQPFDYGYPEYLCERNAFAGIKIALWDIAGKATGCARWELGIAWAVICHVGIARPELDRPAQALIDWVEDDLVLGKPWLVCQGGVRPPDVPGLGVELDRAALARYAQS